MRRPDRRDNVELRIGDRIRRWGSGGRFGDETPPEGFVRLAETQRAQGDLRGATATLEAGIARYPDNMTLATSHAHLAMVTEDWEAAAHRVQSVLDRFVHSPAKLYAWLAVAHVELGNMGTADAVLEFARARHPLDDKVAVQWAGFPLLKRDWVEGVSRCQTVIGQLGDATPAKIYARLALALGQLGQFEEAEDVLERGRDRFPNDAKLAVVWAQQPALVDDSSVALHRWETVLERFENHISAKEFSRAAAEFRHHGAVDAAIEVVQRGRARFPEDKILLRAGAEIAMVRKDWVAATRAWQGVVEAEQRDARDRQPDGDEKADESDDMTDEGKSESPIPAVTLPVRAANLDWHDGAWLDLARAWPDEQDKLGFVPSPSLYEAIADVLRRVGAPEDAARLLHLGLALHPGNPRLRFVSLLADIERRESGLAADARDGDALQAAVASVPDVEARTAIEESWHRSWDFFAAFADQPEGPGATVRIHRIRVPRGSSAEVMVRAANFLTPREVDARVRALSERDEWDELTAGNAPLVARAKRVAQEYGERFEELPYLPAEMLSESAFFLLYADMCVFEPMRRLAADLAMSDRGPVFLELPRSQLTYLNGYAENNLGITEFGQLYLYLELRRRGVNVFLCQFVSPHSTDDKAPLVLTPSHALMQSRPVDRRPGEAEHGAAIVPAGIRAIDQVIERISSPLVVSSGHLIKQFAYDRMFRRGRSVSFSSSIHPARHLLPTIRIEFWRTAHLPAVRISDGSGDGVDIPVDMSAPISTDWLGWFDHVMHEYLVDLSRRCQAEVTLRGVNEAHVSDHLFTESVVFAETTRRAGGRVVLWPHSANPVHEDVRRPESFDVVHAVTRTGCDAWGNAFPAVEVVHSAALMLPPPRREMRVNEREPLSVVVLGGKSTLGSMPFVHQTLHEESYRSFFAGLERLRRRCRIDVFYKPKGLQGENEVWLQRVVGTTADWRAVSDHPLRIDLPNMLFISVSVATSALFEGMSRGIPGLVVKDHESRDYTTLRPGAVPMGTSGEMLAMVEACTNTAVLNDLIEQQLRYYAYEAGMSEHAESAKVT